MPLRKIKGGMLPGIALNRLAKNKHVRNFLGASGGDKRNEAAAAGSKPRAAKATTKKKAASKPRKTQNTRQAKKGTAKRGKY